MKLFTVLFVACLWSHAWASQITLALGGKPANLNPLSSQEYTSLLVQQKIYDVLVERSQHTNKWVPRLAKKFELSKDKKTYTFTLRKGIKWQDGHDFTAKDVYFTYKAIVDPSNKYKAIAASAAFNPLKVKLINDYQISFTFPKAFIGNLDVFYDFFIVPQHFFENPKNKKILNKKLMGTGAYKLKSIVDRKYILLERNKNWWGNSVFPKEHSFQRIKFSTQEDMDNEVRRAGKGIVDYVNLKPDYFIKFSKDKNLRKNFYFVKAEDRTPKYTRNLGLRNDLPIFSHPKTRLALAHLVNRDSINKRIFGGLMKNAIGPISTYKDFTDNSLKPHPYNPKIAQKLLKEAGWVKRKNSPWLHLKSKGKFIPFKFEFITSGGTDIKFLTLYKEELKKAGIDLQIKQLNYATHMQRVMDSKYTACTLPSAGLNILWRPREQYHSESSLALKKGFNFTNYSNPEVDRLIEQLESTTELAKFKRIAKKIQRKLHEDSPLVYLFDRPYEFYMVSKRIKRPADSLPYGLGVRYWKL